MKWIIVANSSDCKIFKYEKNIHSISLLKEIKHPENRLREHDLIADSYGFYKKAGMHRGSYEPETTHTQLAIDNFAREVAGKLNLGRLRHLFDDVIFFMPATMGGMLFKHLNKNVAGMVRKVIHKNLVNLSDHELKRYLCDNLKHVSMLH